MATLLPSYARNDPTAGGGSIHPAPRSTRLPPACRAVSKSGYGKTRFILVVVACRPCCQLSKYVRQPTVVRASSASVPATLIQPCACPTHLDAPLPPPDNTERPMVEATD